MVFPDVAARHARLGQRASAGADRRPDRRPPAKARRPGGAQRLFLSPRSHQRPAHRDRAVRRLHELVARREREGTADQQSGEGCDDRRRPDLAGVRDQLAASELQSQDRAPLRRDGAIVRAAVPHRHGRAARGLRRRRASASAARADGKATSRRSTIEPARSDGDTRSPKAARWVC